VNLVSQAAAVTVPFSSLASENIVEGRLGVVDIGSNTVRLVIYDIPKRLPFPMYNEKVKCRLASGMLETGRLNPEGVEKAMSALSRFKKLGVAMGVENFELLATSAVRDASDGSLFVDQILQSFGFTVKVLSGAEESKLSAVGVLNGLPEADGLLGDLGGGSLDLISLNNGKFGKHATFPFGHIRLFEASGQDIEKARVLITKEFSKTPLIETLKGRTLYAVGGSWRKIAEIIFNATEYPLNVIDGFTMTAETIMPHVRRIAGLEGNWRALDHFGGSRADTLPIAAIVMERLLQVGAPKNIAFSRFGMRDGQMVKSLPDEMRRQDPFIMGCIAMTERNTRFSIGGKELVAWMSPLFEGETTDDFRLRLATCILSDIGWDQHPDYRREYVFNIILRLPFAGLTHEDRAFMALTLFVRCGGELKDPMVVPIRKLLRLEDLKKVQMIGLALRLAHTISGSAPSIIELTELKKKDGKLVLKFPESDDNFISEAVNRRLKRLARVLALKPAVV